MLFSVHFQNILVAKLIYLLIRNYLFSNGIRPNTLWGCLHGGKLSLVEGLPYPTATLGEATLHSFYFILTASVYMTNFTLASDSRVTLGVAPFLRSKVTPGAETTFNFFMQTL